MRKIIALSAVPAIFALLLMVNLNLSSCTKSNPVTIQDTAFVTIHDTTIVQDTIVPAASILSMFTGKQWELDTVYWNYTGPGTGTLIYVRGSSTNIQDLDNYYSTWTIDGYFWQVENGTYYSSTWNFINSDSTTFKIVSPVYGIDYGRITKLDASHLTVYESTSNALDVEILTP